MNRDDELIFGEFLASQMKDRGFTVKKLSDATGIAPVHIENMLHGNFEDLPSAPYLRGYILRIGRTLDFEGADWWKRLRGDEVIANSGPTDALPSNRFVRKSPPKWIWPVAVLGILVLAYLAFALPHVLGRPSIAISYPPGNPFAASSTSITFEGTVRNANALYLSNGGASSSDEIPVAPDGTWRKTVLLQNGLNTFEFSAKKLLGGEANVTEQIVYEPQMPAATTTGPAISAPSASPMMPATGTGNPQGSP